MFHNKVISIKTLRFRLPLYCIQTCKVQQRFHAAISIDSIDVMSKELLQRHRTKLKTIPIELPMRNFMDHDSCNHKEISDMTKEELDATLVNLLSKNKDNKIYKIVTECELTSREIDESTLKQLFRSYSLNGKPEMVATLQKYCSNTLKNLYKRNGEFQHFLAKAQCFKGNSEKGLTILQLSYNKHEGLRGLYRRILRELIEDSVLNRSEASMVIFKKNVLYYSQECDDHYPLIFFWHICWSSSWFSDQVMSNELLEVSEELRNIIKDRAVILSINALKEEYNEDAVVRLLQNLLKFGMLNEYAKVLQVLFNYKIKNRDLRGCTEIIRNCEALGIKLPSDQQGRYIRLMIRREEPEKPETKDKQFKDFKLKF